MIVFCIDFLNLGLVKTNTICFVSIMMVEHASLVHCQTFFTLHVIELQKVRKVESSLYYSIDKTITIYLAIITFQKCHSLALLHDLSKYEFKYAIMIFSYLDLLHDI